MRCTFSAENLAKFASGFSEVYVSPVRGATPPAQATGVPPPPFLRACLPRTEWAAVWCKSKKVRDASSDSIIS
ncbi:unnamed protein product, partial [Iphiclides podalirius]